MFFQSMTFANVNIVLFGNIQSQSVFRGAVTYSKPSAIAGPSFIFFDTITIAGPSLFYSYGNPRKDKFIFKLGVKYVDDGVPLFVSSSKEDFKNQRRNTVELSSDLQYSFGKKNKFGFGLQFHKDIKRHKKSLIEFNAKAPILPFTSLKLLTSFAQKEMNQYIYGPSSTSGAAYTSANIDIVIPFVPWEGIAKVGVVHTWVMKESNENAEYIRGDGKNFHSYFRLIWNVL
tara:strand:+ start:80188 stop:80877 length:690 start_codon:yes stop_codon:yes gene_type:complete